MGNNQDRNSLGKYQLIASLGQGGMAKVYLALVAGPAGVNKLMVVKVLQNDTLTGPEGGVALFWDEARLSTRLVHPNIVHTYEVGEVDGSYFLAMEYLDGQTYRVLQARASQDPLPLHEALRILSEVARGLHYAHELRDFHGEPLGVVHRDVSPANVFLTYDGQVKLIDFGIAKTRDADHETRVGLIKGKLNYIAPEQLRGDPLDRRADVFALGILLWEAIAGRRFAGGPGVTEVAKVHARIKGDEPNVRVVKPGIPEELAAIVDRAIALDRDQRFADAISFADALDTYIENTGQRPSAKSLSAWMHSLFAQDRAAMHKVIEERVQGILQHSPAANVSDLPVLPMAEEVHTGSGMVKSQRATRHRLRLQRRWQLGRPGARTATLGCSRRGHHRGLGRHHGSAALAGGRTQRSRERIGGCRTSGRQRHQRTRRIGLAANHRPGAAGRTAAEHEPDVAGLAHARPGLDRWRPGEHAVQGRLSQEHRAPPSRGHGARLSLLRAPRPLQPRPRSHHRVGADSRAAEEGRPASRARER
jgi:serine/threonine protein kinase